MLRLSRAARFDRVAVSQVVACNTTMLAYNRFSSTFKSQPYTTNKSGRLQPPPEAQRAFDVFDDMKARGIKPGRQTYSDALVACMNGVQWDRALDIFDEMKANGMELDSFIYNATIWACASRSTPLSSNAAGMPWHRAFDLFDEMKVYGIGPCVWSYAAIISVCKKRADWARALILFREMKRSGIQPDVMCFNATISVCLKGQQWEHMFSLFNEMQECGVESDVITYSSIISACEKSSQWERALELLSEMRERGIEPNVITYSAAISACGKGAQWKRALGLLSEMREHGIEPNVFTYNAVIEACCHRADAEMEARRVYRASLDSRVQSHWKKHRVDLHHMSVAIAKTAVAVVLEDIRSGQCTRLPHGSDLMIITGRGKRSDDGIAKLRPAVLEMLAEPEYAALGAAIDSNNKGCVRVPAACLVNWLSESH